MCEGGEYGGGWVGVVVGMGSRWGGGGIGGLLGRVWVIEFRGWGIMF